MVVAKTKIKRAINDPELVWHYSRDKVQKSFKKLYEGSEKRHYEIPIKLKLEIPRISKNIITFKWKSDNEIPMIRKNTWSIIYPNYVDLSTIPRELLWMIYSLMTSEFFAQASKITIILPEKLDERFLKWWKGVLKINHTANPYNGNLSAESEFKLVNGDKEIKINNLSENIDDFEFVCMNGMGKDALVQMAMLRELTQEPILAVTVDNSWLFQKKNMFKKLVELSENLKEYDIHPCIVSSQIKESFDFKIVPWQIFSIPLLYLHNVKTCYWAIEFPFNKCINGIPVKPNATVILLESINNLLKDLGYEFEFKSGVLPLTTFGTMKLLIERYPKFQKFQYSCMYRYPPCSRGLKCQSQMAYITLCGRDYRELGYRDVKIIDLSTLSTQSILDIEREPIEHAINKVNGVNDGLNWVEKYYKDTLPYAIPEVEKILKEHFDAFEGPFTSYGIYKYDVREWNKTIDNIYSLNLTVNLFDSQD